MKLVSVIMPYFKKKEYVLKSLNSIISQSYKNLEIIIIDDELSQESQDLMKKLSNLDQRIHTISNPSNLGAGLSRNNGILIAKGEYIAFCDCDDVWSSKKLEVQLKYMKSNYLNFTHTSYLIIDSNDKIIGRRKAKKIISYKKLVNSCDIGLSTVVIKKNLLKNNNLMFPKIETKEDYVLWLKISESGEKINGYDEYLSSWRKSENSLSSSISQRIKDGYKVYNTFLGYGVLKSVYCLLILSINFMLKKK